MKIMTRPCGDHFHAAVFDEYGDIMYETVGVTREDALDALGVEVMMDAIVMLSFDDMDEPPVDTSNLN